MNNGINVDWNLIGKEFPNLLIIVLILMIVDAATNPSKNNQASIPFRRLQKRKDFAEKTKKSVLLWQGNRCNSCLKPLEGIQDFHHKNGNRADNGYWNCEALCPNCHARKTRRS